jgi:hypothetical protein
MHLGDEMENKIEHAPHYGGENNPYEAIKIIEYWDLGFNLGNVVKYIIRCGRKHPSTKGKIDDLKKAIWYLSREIDVLQKEDTE